MGLGRWAALVLAAALALSGSIVSSAQAAEETAVQSYGGCLLGQRAGDLLILLDQSGSVSRTDPGDPKYDNQPARARGANALLQQLADATRRQQVDLQVKVAGFGSDYDRGSRSSWTGLSDPQGLSRLRTAVKSASRTGQKAGAFETDYWSGLEGARKDLAAHAGSDPSRCQALLWFTDGRFNLKPRKREQLKTYGATKPYAPGVRLTNEEQVKAAEKLGEQDLCSNTGPSNQLRAGGVTLLGIGLDKDESKKTNDFTLMKQIVTNEAGDCGDLRQPPGQFWQAKDLGDMLAAFDQIAHPGGQVTRQFVLDDLLTSVHVRGEGSGGLRYSLLSPSGEQLPLPINGATSGQLPGSPGIEVRWSWQTSSLITVDLVREPGASWRGLWKVEITDAAGARAETHPTVSFTADLYPTWTAPPAGLVSGGTTTAQLGLARADGKPLAVTDVPGTLTVTTSLVDARGAPHELGGGISKEGLASPVPVDLTSVPPGRATVTSRLIYTTAAVDGQSTTLDPQTVQQPVTVNEPPVVIRVAVSAFILALLAGVGLPLAGLYLAKYLGAKIPGQTALEAIRLPVEVVAGDVTTDGRPLTLETLPPPAPVDLLRKGTRSVEAAGVGLQTRVGASPVSAGWVEAGLDGQPGASSESGRPLGRRRAARLPLAVHNTWALFHDPAGPANRGLLLLLRGLDVTDTDRAALLEDARRRVPALLTALRAEGGGGGGGTAPTPSADASGWSSGSFGASGEGWVGGSAGADGPRPPRPATPSGSATGSETTRPSPPTPPSSGGTGGSIDWTQGGFGSSDRPSGDPPRTP